MSRVNFQILTTRKALRLVEEILLGDGNKEMLKKVAHSLTEANQATIAANNGPGDSHRAAPPDETTQPEASNKEGQNPINALAIAADYFASQHPSVAPVASPPGFFQVAANVHQRPNNSNGNDPRMLNMGQAPGSVSPEKLPSQEFEQQGTRLAAQRDLNLMGIPVPPAQGFQPASHNRGTWYLNAGPANPPSAEHIGPQMIQPPQMNPFASLGEAVRRINTLSTQLTFLETAFTDLQHAHGRLQFLVRSMELNTDRFARSNNFQITFYPETSTPIARVLNSILGVLGFISSAPAVHDPVYYGFKEMKCIFPQIDCISSAFAMFTFQPAFPHYSNNQRAILVTCASGILRNAIIERAAIWRRAVLEKAEVSTIPWAIEKDELVGKFVPRAN